MLPKRLHYLLNFEFDPNYINFQALGPNHSMTVATSKEPAKPKKARAENHSDHTFFKCDFCEYSCDKVCWMGFTVIYF